MNAEAPEGADIALVGEGSFYLEYVWWSQLRIEGMTLRHAADSKRLDADVVIAPFGVDVLDERYDTRRLGEVTVLVRR